VKAYYHARAREYDEWWLGVGRYADRKPPDWDEARDGLTAFIETLPPARTLDVACGTGFITQHLPGEVTGLDQSEAMIEIARERVPGASFVIADALDLPFPDDTFDRVFASFFYCHLEEAERLRFLAEVRRVAHELIVVGTIGREDEAAARWDERVLNDGSRWRVYKRVFDPKLLAEELGGEVLYARRRLLVVRS
jgi:ubiquinone/menaquinone biosynthesis C-methylase UbiE